MPPESVYGEEEIQAARRFRVGLPLGIYTIPEVKAWADRHIQTHLQPATAMIDLALLSSNAASPIVEKLGEITGGYNYFQVLQTCLPDAAKLLSDQPSYCPRLAKLIHDYGLLHYDDMPGRLEELIYYTGNFELNAQGEGPGEAELCQKFIALCTRLGAR